MTEFETITANAYRLPSLTTPAHEEALLASILRTDKHASRTLRLPGKPLSIYAPPSAGTPETRIAVMSAIAKGARTNVDVRAAIHRGETTVGNAVKALILDGMVKRKPRKGASAGLYLTPKGAGVLAAAADARFRGQ